MYFPFYPPRPPHWGGGNIFFFHFGKVYDESGGKGEKREINKGVKGEKREQINKGKTYDKICYLGGDTRVYFPPICTVPTWWGKYHIGRGGGGNMIFWEIYTPGTFCREMGGTSGRFVWRA